MENQHVQDRLTEDDKDRAATLIAAANMASLALIQCFDTRQQKHIPVFCRVVRMENGDYQTFPLASLLEGDPFEYLIPPQ